MRFGNWRGVACALTLTFAIAAGFVSAARADGFGSFCTIPREVQAIDVKTGQPYYAPPIPYGHYAKGCYLPGTSGALASLRGMFCGSGSGCHGNDCDGNGGGGCSSCGGTGCGFCQGKKLLGCFGGLGHGGGGCFGKPVTYAVQASPQVIPSPQGVIASPQCEMGGCAIVARHHHRRGHGCNSCGGAGCGMCMDPGGSSGCGLCGGRGCSSCIGGGGMLHSLVAKVLHKNQIKYFVGPGGPVPLTPGYVPYVVTTRSPRDFFAFPPFATNVP